ncbi:uncharacterized protein TRIVIDRAFT_206729 [Trichoderma virens Gv29-8]|uniref:Uncharacterized protein n=1 Tax=Hypocrea virens (strain Gv29-8 / FGSC 10586) TaxID=413071 RepID=G9NB65_HYPVG|nr:uncharacterized protein TRIVIDRAFT_206729 [Trichoderma virens Gv29-8]EHK16073.1 hypothetical protein TRIVIDRAFT_206729 [Trichoderma virens Gv29-8]UKZ56150.1 hypothetical protein TrVGV298_009978 [Trichoderma virens]
MPTSSTGAIYSPTNADNGPQAASSDGAKLVILAGIPDDPKYCMDRFLSDNNETSAEYQRPPIEFSQTQSEDEAEAKSKTRILAKLCAFDKKLASTSGRNIANKCLVERTNVIRQDTRRMAILVLRATDKLGN